ncbi:glycosyltransferase family 2 protein [Patescibacteria group bacterium]
MTTLSIIIVSFNTKELTVGCIESIYKQKPEFGFDIMVVDNNSNDGSVEELKKLALKHKSLKVICNKDNSGYAKANNQGIKVSRGKYTLLLNSDTIVKKNALTSLVEFAEKTSDVGVVGSRLFNIDGSMQMSCYRFPTITNAIREYWLGEKGLFEKFAPKGNKPTEIDAVVGASFLITPEARKKVGILDERYWAYFEDIDYCRQAWKAGLKVYYLPASEVIHHHGASFKKAGPDESKRWRRLIPSSKIYHGIFKHYLINAIIWLGQKWQKLLKILS